LATDRKSRVVLAPKPSLAESWEVAPEGKTVTFKLRIHDEKPFTAADMQFAIMEVLKSRRGARVEKPRWARQ
jgi:ABC-type transport system substrate-binding protein